jgi:hypothetical protein
MTTLDLTNNIIKNKIKQISPVCYLHSEEIYFPMRLNDYLNLCYYEDEEKVPITNIQQNKDIYPIDPNNSAFRGNSNINDVPYIVKVNDNKDGTSNIIYFFFFGYNGDTRVFFNLFGIGKHFSDIEHIVIKVDNNKFINNDKIIDSIISVFYSEHSGGRLVKRNDLKFENDKVIVYLANRTHAAYPQEGLYIRFFGFGNDRTEKFYRWTPNEMVYAIEDNFINTFKNNLGGEHVSGFADKSYYNGGDEENEPEGIYINHFIYDNFLTVVLLLVIYDGFKIYFSGDYSIKLVLYIILFIILFNLKIVNIK